MKTITRGLAVLGALVVGWIAFSYVRVKLERARARAADTADITLDEVAEVPPEADVR
jgi:uncharacterized membrane protein YeiB